VNDPQSPEYNVANRQRAGRNLSDRARVEKYVALERTIALLEHNLDEWRRFHDWVVLKKGKLDLIEEIISLGHKYSGLLSRFKVAKEFEQERLLVGLQVVLRTMQALYLQSKDRKGFDLDWKSL